MAVLVRNRVRVTVRCKVRIRVRAKLFRVRSRVSSRVRVMSSECHLSWCVAFRQTHRPIVPVSTMGVCTYESVYCLIFVKHLKLHSANSEHVQVYFWTSSPALPCLRARRVFSRCQVSPFVQLTTTICQQPTLAFRASTSRSTPQNWYYDRNFCCLSRPRASALFRQSAVLALVPGRCRVFSLT